MELQQREIRFRAWDKMRKQMGEVYELHITIPYEDTCVAIQFEDSDEEGNIIYPKTEYTISSEQCVLMQFTGLYDKNKQPIFEGDVVRFRDDFVPDEPLIEAEVMWDRGSFMVRGADRLWELHNADDSFELEVIGNIFENPELLDK